MPTMTYGKTNITYQFYTKPDIHYVKIYVDDLNGVQVTASESRRRENIDAFLRKKAIWIKHKWQSIHKGLYQIDRLNLADGQRITYLGRSYRLFIEESNEDDASFTFQQGKFYFFYPASMKESERHNKMFALIKRWLYNKADSKFDTIHKSRTTVEEDQTRLGRKQDGQIRLNWRLIQQSKEEIKEKIEHLYQEKTC